MMYRFCRPGLPLLLLALTACSSAPVHFFTLTPPAGQAVSTNTDAPFLLDVQPVDIPAQVDQPQITVREGAQGVMMLETDQWAAPLGSEIRESLSDALVADLHAQDVHGLSHQSDMPVYRVRVSVRRFDSSLGQDALIDATWSVHGMHGKAVLSCRSVLRESVGPGMDALVRGHQRAVQALAGKIAAVIRDMAHSHAPSCPAG